MAHEHSIPPTASPWSRLLRRTAVLLAIWFLVGPLMGILLVEPLNELSLGGIPLGFWVAQQGSIYVFIILIFAYAFMGDRLDRETPTERRGATGPAGSADPTGGPTGNGS